MQQLFFTEFTSYENKWNFKNTLNHTSYFEINKESITFKFSGFLTLDNYLICVFPKGFIQYDPLNMCKNTVQQDAQLLISVFKKYNRHSVKKQNINKNNIEYNNNNYISLAEELTKDYLKHDLITPRIRINRINGSGKINWNRTVKKILPNATENNAYIYLDLITENTLKSVSSDLQEIHWLILKDIESKVGWLLNFKVKNINVITQKLNVKRAKSILQKTINITFNVFLLQRLKLLYQYLKEDFYSHSQKNDAPFQLYYTFHFQNIWEDICKVIFDNQTELHSFIPKYCWQHESKLLKESTLIPDILTDFGKDTLAIIDAKYYPEKKDGESKLPPSGDISKQLIYRKVLSLTDPFTNKKILNIFILPALVSQEDSYLKQIAKVCFENDALNKDLKEIITLQLDTKRAMQEYLSNSINFKSRLFELLL